MNAMTLPQRTLLLTLAATRDFGAEDGIVSTRGERLEAIRAWFDDEPSSAEASWMIDNLQRAPVVINILEKTPAFAAQREAFLATVYNASQV